jgi:dipeptidyl aminopeptidase/acylaminoacyl peptidase
MNRSSRPTSRWGRPAAVIMAFMALGLAAELSASTTDTTAVARRLLTPADYGQFETLGGAAFSPDGRWMSATVTRFDADGEVRLAATDGQEVRVFPKATRLDFAEGGRWAVVVLAPGQDDRRRLEQARRPIRNDLVLLDLTGQVAPDTIREVQTHALSPDGRWILLRRYRPEGANAGRGADVLVRPLGGATVTQFGSISESAWADTGALLALVTDAEGQAGNGVRLFDPATGRIRTLETETTRFQGLTWRTDSRDLAVFRADPDTVRGDTLFTVLAWRGVDREGVQPARLEGPVTLEGKDPMRVTAARGLRWSEDGARIFIALQARAPERDPDARRPGNGAAPAAGGAPQGGGGAGARPDSVPGLEIWHARDIDPIPQQRLRANQDRNRSALAAWTLTQSTPVYLGGDVPGEGVTILPGEQRALVQDDTPWGQERMFGPMFRDVYVVDVATGDRSLVRRRVEFYQGASPTGRYLLFFEDNQYFIHDLVRGEARSLTAGIPTSFENLQTDVVVDQKPPYGVGGWTEGDQHVLLYDQFDIWRVRPDGSNAERITEGATEQIRHRLVRIDTNETFYSRTGPWVVALYGERTKASGYGELRPGRPVDRLLYDDRSISRIARSDDGRRMSWVSQRYDLPPTLHVADARFQGARDLIQVNTFVADSFLWGRSELLDFTNGWGVPLQASLHYPADFEPGKQYPMVVYHYERVSQGVHSWINPSDRNAYNITAFTQNGYFVLQPDIVYRPRDPGRSAMATFEPVLDAAIATGHIDPARIGIMGHSWGGYQTTFAVTQTDRFAAGVAGAPLTNLMSMYLSFYWNSGSTDARIFEISQGRMEVPWWQDYEAYRMNSPVHHIEAMNTPLLMAFGTEDGAVEFNQGVEFYNAARRAGKDFVLLVYDGENHSLARRPNQIDYHRRTLEWFAHYLKGEPAPDWITEGVGYLDQQEKLRNGPAAGRIPGPTAPRAEPPAGGEG